MADVQPFRAVRYTGAAGPLADLVAPPYDAVDDEERASLYTRSPYNVVHVTLARLGRRGRRLYRDWLAEACSSGKREPAVVALVEEYVGPGRRRRASDAASSPRSRPSRTRPAPSCRTSARTRAIREERLRLLRATRVQPEPIFVLADGRSRLDVARRGRPTSRSTARGSGAATRRDAAASSATASS